MSAAYWPGTGNMVRRLLALASLLLAVVSASTTRAEEAPPLEIGIAPYYSTQLLFQQYEPLRAYLSEALRRPIYLVTARDFRTFALRTRAHDYGFIVTVPHFGRLAQVDDGYRPLLQMKAQLQGVFLVAKTSPAQQLADLRGRMIASPDRLAIITMMGEQALAKAGVDPDYDVRLTPKPTHNAAVLSVLNGESDAALVWHSTLASMEPEAAARLREIGATTELPTFVQVLAAPELPDADVEVVRAAIAAFSDTPQGQAFLGRTAYGRFVPLGPDDSAFLDEYLPKVRRALEAEPK
jgi:phosphonate transport system substrate-binding protein